MHLQHNICKQNYIVTLCNCYRAYGVISATYKACVFLFSVFVPIAAFADYLDGNTLKDLWDEKYHEGKATFRGYVAGVQDSYNGVVFCVNAEVRISQATEIVAKYIKENPEKWHMAGKFLVIEALTKTFPCKN